MAAVLEKKILPSSIHVKNSGEGIAALIPPESTLENYFAKFRKGIIGNGQTFDSPYGEKELIYADWTASGRAYQPIDDCIASEIMPFTANTHTQATHTGTLMTNAYENAKAIVKQHVHASGDDALVFCGSGTTGAVNKLQRILGLRMPERIRGLSVCWNNINTAKIK
jgi:selenocysteine lyase/cysteine desulfurase